MRLLPLLVFIISSFSGNSFADPVPAKYKDVCRKWENGYCVEGDLTDLAESIRVSTKVTANESSCGRICNEACPNCGKCSLCSFCWIYRSPSCAGVGYYTDADTCAEAQTQDCCDLCEAHCGDNGACAEGEYCQGGDRSTSTIVKCIEQTQGEICETCRVNGN